MKVLITAVLLAGTATATPTLGATISDEMKATRLEMACPAATRIKFDGNEIVFWPDGSQSVADIKKCLTIAYTDILANPWPVSEGDVREANHVYTRDREIVLDFK